MFLNLRHLQKILPGHKHSDYIMAPVILREEYSQQQVIDYLKSKNIGSRSIYSTLSYQQPCYQDLSTWYMSRVVEYPDYTKVSSPNAELIARNHFEIPMVTSLTDESLDYIVSTLKDFFTN